MKNVVILGKGDLSIHICEWFWKSPDYNLMYVVPVSPSPTWAKSLAVWCINNNVKWVYAKNNIYSFDNDKWVKYDSTQIGIKSAYDL